MKTAPLPTFPYRPVLVAILLISFVAAPVKAQKITIVPYDALGGKSAPLATADKGPFGLKGLTGRGDAKKYAAYTITLKDYVVPGTPAFTFPEIRIWTKGPTFDAYNTAARLLQEMRTSAASGPARGALEATATDSYHRQLLLPAGPETLTEQAISQGFTTSLAQQLTSSYPTVAASFATPDGVTQTKRQRQIYAIKSPLDLPRYVKPGSAFRFTFENLNWLKYTAEVDGKAYERQFSLAADFENAPTAPPAPAGGSSGAPPLSPEEINRQAVALAEKGTSYRLLHKALVSTYQADYWPNAAADMVRREQLSKAIFGTTTASAAQFTNQPQELQKQVTSFLTRVHAAIGRNGVTRADETNAKSTLADLTAYLGSDAIADEYKKQLPVLGDALVKLRSVESVLLSSTLLMPEDKDEVDVTVEYKPRTDYQSPPGIALGGPPKQSVTIMLLPRFRITGSVGPYYSGLVDHQFLFLNDSVAARIKQTTTDTTTRLGYLARKKIVRQNDDETFSGVGASVFINFEYRLRPGLGTGLSLGVGAQNDGLRLLLGPSVLLGNTQRVVFSGGLAAGRVIRLARGYGLGHENAIRDPGTSVVPTRMVNTTSWFVGLSYNLSSSRK